MKYLWCAITLSWLNTEISGGFIKPEFPVFRLPSSVIPLPSAYALASAIQAPASTACGGGVLSVGLFAAVVFVLAVALLVVLQPAVLRM